MLGEGSVKIFQVMLLFDFDQVLRLDAGGNLSTHRITFGYR